MLLQLSKKTVKNSFLAGLFLTGALFGKKQNDVVRSSKINKSQKVKKSIPLPALPAFSELPSITRKNIVALSKSEQFRKELPWMSVVLATYGLKMLHGSVSKKDMVRTAVSVVGRRARLPKKAFDCLPLTDSSKKNLLYRVVQNYGSNDLLSDIVNYLQFTPAPTGPSLPAPQPLTGVTANLLGKVIEVVDNLGGDLMDKRADDESIDANFVYKQLVNNVAKTAVKAAVSEKFKESVDIVLGNLSVVSSEETGLPTINTNKTLKKIVEKLGKNAIKASAVILMPLTNEAGESRDKANDGDFKLKVSQGLAAAFVAEVMNDLDFKKEAQSEKSDSIIDFLDNTEDDNEIDF